MHPLDEVFTPGLVVWGGDGVRVVKEVGVVAVPSGRLLIADPMSLDDAKPLTVPVGEHRVRLALVRMFGTHECAGVRVDVARRRVVRWRKTRVVCGVDSATACVADASVVTALADDSARERFTASWERMSAAPGPSRKLRLGGRVVLAFRVHDDGGYRVLEGVDARGRLAALGVVWSRSAILPPRG